MSAVMRAKLRVSAVSANATCETLSFNAVYKSSGYPADGKDEDNTFATWTPSASLQMSITNPDLLGKFKVGDAFYVDFTPVPA